MRPINLLPEGERPYVPTGTRRGSSYAVVGVLAVLLLATMAYVLIVNSITSTREQTEQASQEAGRAEAKNGRLSAFGDFAQARQTRYSSVTDLARGRFDWERLMRELGRVLPASIYVRELTAGTNGGAGEAGSPPSGSSGGDDPAAAGKPQLILKGCAPSQPEVATMLVRLRSLHRVEGVELAESAKPMKANGGGASTPGQAPAPAAASSSPAPAAEASAEGCGTRSGRADYKFEAKVLFSSDEGATEKPAARVPSRLGGGA